ncbi:MAG: DUF559 domain-containing protein [Bacteroidia bacterium]|nr:DUF559 domain-containing protein [Bacteroidia bacterium]
MKLHNYKYLKQRRKDLRSNLTPAEAILWKALQASKLDNRKFRRQHSIGNYIVDFYCSTEKLIIEVDGKIHDDYSVSLHDEKRSEFLIAHGFRKLRIVNEDIYENIEGVLQEIRNSFNEKTSPNPSL